MTDPTTTDENSVHDNYQRALTYLIGTLSTKIARSVGKSVFATKYGVDPDTLRALVQLDCIEPAKGTPSDYRALPGLLYVTPEQVIERLAVMKNPVVEVVTEPVAKRPYVRKPKEVSGKPAPAIVFYKPEPSSDTSPEETKAGELMQQIKDTANRVVEGWPETIERFQDTIAASDSAHSQRPPIDKTALIQHLHSMEGLCLKIAHASADLSRLLTEFANLDNLVTPKP